ncbi:hypothetical protein WN943_009536 [Citrus x changshan-huyou]
MQSHLNGPDSMRRMESCLDDILVDEYSSNVSGLVDSQMNILLDLLEKQFLKPQLLTEFADKKVNSTLDFSLKFDSLTYNHVVVKKC